MLLCWAFTYLEESKFSLQWHHNESDGVPNRQPHDCLFNVPIKENIKVSRHWLLWGEFTGDKTSDSSIRLFMVELWYEVAEMNINVKTTSISELITPTAKENLSSVLFPNNILFAPGIIWRTCYIHNTNHFPWHCVGFYSIPVYVVYYYSNAGVYATYLRDYVCVNMSHYPTDERACIHLTTFRVGKMHVRACSCMLLLELVRCMVRACQYTCAVRYPMTTRRWLS